MAGKLGKGSHTRVSTFSRSKVVSSSILDGISQYKIHTYKNHYDI